MWSLGCSKTELRHTTKIIPNNTIQMIAKDYTGDKGKAYAIERGQDNLNHLGDKIQASLFLKHLKPDDDVLDFGCGNGSIAKQIVPHTKSICGLEVNLYPRALAVGQGLTVYGTIAEIPDEVQFDVIISNHVFEHVVNVVETLQELRKRVRPGGRMILILPLDDWRQKSNANWHASDPNHHLHTWTPLLIGNTLAEAGFQPQAIRVLTFAWSYKLFFLGDGVVQHLACRLLSIFKKKRQILAIAINNSTEPL